MLPPSAGIADAQSDIGVNLPVSIANSSTLVHVRVHTCAKCTKISYHLRVSRIIFTGILPDIKISE